MAEQNIRTIKTRIINKHATAAVWDNTDFVPLQGEWIIYDKDNDYPYERAKIGDGSKTVSELPFVDETYVDRFVTKSGNSTINGNLNVDGTLTMGSKEVATEAFVNDRMAELIGLNDGEVLDETLDTIKELQDAIKNNEDVVEAIKNTTYDLISDSNSETGEARIKLVSSDPEEPDSIIGITGEGRTTVTSDEKGNLIIETPVIPVATTEKDGIMSADDKKNLDSLYEASIHIAEATEDGIIEETITPVVGITESLVFAAGKNVSLVPDTDNKAIVIEAADTTHSFYEGVIGTDGDTIEEVFEAKKPEGGYGNNDVFVVKTPIINDKFAYTSYVYDGENSVWKAMVGNYHAENVYFDENITITSAVGNIELENGSGEIPAAGKNLKQVFESIWTSEAYPEATDPTVEITTSLQYKEVGSTVTPSYTATLNPGSYTYGPETSISAQTWSVTFGNETKTTDTGSFSNIVITEGACCNVTATATYNDGTIPVTNLKNEYPSKQIKAGSASVSKNLFIGYRPNFYGFKTTAIDLDNIDSEVVRALGTNQAQTTTPVSTATSNVSWMQFFYAVPKGRKTELSVKDSNNLPLTVNSKEVIVNHVGGVSSTYTVFYINNDAAYGATKLTLTWK